MLETGMPAVEVMSEYVRACRRLGHSTPEPADLHAAYTAEDGVDLPALDTDGRALSEIVAAAEDALQLQEQARRALGVAWQGAGPEAAADHLRRHAEAAQAALAGLRGAAAALGELRNRLWQLIDAKVERTVSVEARGMRDEWLAAARTVTTGAGDRSGASELVDMQVAPFVADDVGVDWVSSMRDTESAIRQAYRDAAAMAASTAVFGSPGAIGPQPVATEPVSYPDASPAVGTPAGYAAAPMPGPGAGYPAVSPAPTVPTGAAPPADPMAAAAPLPAMPPPGGLAGGASPLGSGLSGLSGLGQSVADILGGLLGSGGDALGDSLVDDGDPESDPDVPELGDPPDGEDPDEEDPDEEDPEEDDPEEEDDAEDGTTPPEEPTDPVEPTEPVAPTEPAAPVAPRPDPPVPTPVPEPPAESVAVPAEPDPTDTPCEIAADELPQAGP